ncbi:MAG: tetratricopeptide repeat protein [Sandaracinaceae bacterium]
MGWLRDLLSFRRRDAISDAALRELRASIEGAAPDEAWRVVSDALVRHRGATALLHLAARVLRDASEQATAELFDRAADAPQDPQRWFELGSDLNVRGSPHVAATFLERALELAPFDAVVRSELALAEAHRGRPTAVREALALHPCLADDPGALFQFAWASMLCGDLEAARASQRELHGVGKLGEKLARALSRAEGHAMEDARDFYYIEHGSLLLDAGGELGGRYGEVAIDPAWCARLIGELASVVRELPSPPAAVIPIEPRDAPLAERVAEACGLPIAESGAGLAVAVDASRLDAAWQCGLHPSTTAFAVWADFRRPLARAPELLGVMAREVTRLDLPARVTAHGAAPSAIAELIEARREHLFDGPARVGAAYVPDAPLPW